jgi:hypothetical protein
MGREVLGRRLSYLTRCLDKVEVEVEVDEDVMPG